MRRLEDLFEFNGGKDDDDDGGDDGDGCRLCRSLGESVEDEGRGVGSPEGKDHVQMTSTLGGRGANQKQIIQWYG